MRRQTVTGKTVTGSRPGSRHYVTSLQRVERSQEVSGRAESGTEAEGAIDWFLESLWDDRAHHDDVAWMKMSIIG